MNNGRKKWRKWTKLRAWVGPATSASESDWQAVEAALCRVRDDAALQALERARRAIAEADALCAAIITRGDERAELRRAKRRARQAAKGQLELPFGYDRLAF